MTTTRPNFAPTALAIAISLSAANLHAADLPTGGNIVGGSGSISQDGNSLNVQQNSDRLITNWDSFDIGAGHTVNFYQPGSNSVALNRVIGEDASAIYGNLNANGKVFLVNPNGVLFGQGAAVNVGALVASTLSLSDEDFNNGNYQFQGDGNNAAVINRGSITADGGAVALLGGQVSNHGIIQANQGTVALAAGDKITLDFAGDGLLNVTVDKGTIDALVENHQLVRANGGQVIMTANATNALLQTVVNNTGVIEAQTLDNQNGTIVLKGGFNGGTVNVAGTLDASAPDSGDGGFIDTSGAHVKVANGTQVTTKANNGTTGEWLIDPTDFTVNAGNATGTDSGIGADTLSANLANNSITLQTVASGSEAGDINVQAAVTWNADTTLTLNAHNDININAAITAQGANGKVALQYGQATTDGGTADYHINAPINLQNGNNFSTQKGSAGSVISYTVVNDAAALQAMNSDLAANYAVGSNIDLGSISNWQPVGGSDRFTGTFNGLGHTLSSLTIDRSGTDYVGLFGATASGSVIRDIGLVGGSVSGRNHVGGLVGVNSGIISNAYATGSVEGTERVGGLLGFNQSGTINNAYATGTVKGTSYVGGLVGVMNGSIDRSYATGNVTGTFEQVGGLVGDLNGSVTDSYASGNVNGNNQTGGLVGNSDGTITASHASGNVNGSFRTGGLVGRSDGTISQSYATGSVSSATFTGGLVGQSWGAINQSYASGRVSGSDFIGALVGGYFGPPITNSYWNTETSGQSIAVGGGSSTGITGLTTAQMFDAANFSGFDFAGTWANANDQTTPYLRALAGNRVFNKNDLPTGTLDATNRPALYTVIQNVEQLQAMRNNLSANYLLGNNIDATATASWNGGAGFVPVGNATYAYRGDFDGLGYSINGLTINRPSTNNVGLFGVIFGSQISNIGLTNAAITGRDKVGGVAGHFYGSVRQSYVTGRVSGRQFVGGLIGYSGGSIRQTYSAADVSGSDSFVGGLIGFASDFGTIIEESYATGQVGGTTLYIGALIGTLDGSILNTYWNTETSGQTSAVGFSSVGTSGMTGLTTAQMLQADSFAGWDIDAQGGTGTVWRIYEGYTAPLLRHFLTALEVTGDTTTTTYNGTEQAGTWSAAGEYDADHIFGQASGGRNAGTYNIDMSGLYSDQQGYDLITTGGGTLTINKAQATVTAHSGTTTYNGTEQSVDGFTVDGLVNGEDQSVLTGVTTSGGKGTNAGSYTLTASGTDGNYELSFVDGTLTIERKAITGNITADGKTYDGSTYANTHGTLDGVISGDDLQFNTTGAFADKHVGTGKQVTVSGSLGGGDAGNYVLTTNSSTTANIDRKTITADIRALDKLFDGSLAATLEGVLNGTISGDDVALQLSGLFASLTPGENRVLVDASLTGADAGNYQLVAPDSVTANMQGFVQSADYQSANVSQPPESRQLSTPGDTGYQLDVDDDALHLPMASR
jgi:filamentous hemagglutinin family protein